jgi:hypothetical protein
MLKVVNLFFGSNSPMLKPALKNVMRIGLSSTSTSQQINALPSRGMTTRTFDLPICGGREYHAKFYLNRSFVTAIQRMFITNSCVFHGTIFELFSHTQTVTAHDGPSGLNVP